MASNIPYGTQWIKDLVPNVSWDSSTQNIMMPDGSVLPKSSYTIVDSKAYVKPEAVSKYTSSAGSQSTGTGLVPTAPAAAPASVNKVQTAAAPVSGTVWLRDLDPGAQWDDATKSITLSNGTKLPSQVYTIVGGKAYVNPYAIASYFAPKTYTAENTQDYINEVSGIYQPIMDHSYDRINTLISTLQNKLNATTNNINAQAGVSQNRLQAQEQDAAAKLLKQAMARGTYTSGVADYQQEQLAGDYAKEYENLANTVAANIASANADVSGNLATLGEQATSLEDSYMEKILGLVGTLMNNEYTQQNNTYQNILASGANSLNQNTTDLQSAIARTELFGRVTTEADAKMLGVPIGTSSYQALSDMMALSASGSSGGSGGTGNGGTGEGGSLDFNTMSTEQKRAYDAAMKLWEATGRAPAGILQQMGYPVGTPYTPEIAAQVDQETTVRSYVTKIQAKYQSIRAINAEAAARALTYTNGSKTAALQWLENNKSDLQAQGVNIDTVRKAINGYDSGPSPYSNSNGTTEKASWEFQWNDPSTWFD